MKTMLNLIIYLLLITSAALASSLKDVHIGLGNLTQFPGTIQTTLEGETNGFEFSPYLQMGLRFQLIKSTPNLTLLTELILAPQETRDPNISKFTFMTLLSAAYAFNDIEIIGIDYKIPWIDFKLGTGLSVTKISGDGGTQMLNNGASTDSFPLPFVPSFTKNIIITSGIEIAPIKSFSIKSDIHIYNIHESESRATSYIISAHYHLPSKWYKGW